MVDKDLTTLSDEELEAEGFRLDAERAEAEKHWKDLQLAQQAEFSRRYMARQGAAPQPESEPEEAAPAAEE
jgi:hypothetical protein